jgi:hypothetical protein
MSCESKCYETRARDAQGRLIRVATVSGKYAKGEQHPACKDCLESECENHKRLLANLEPGQAIRIRHNADGTVTRRVVEEAERKPQRLTGDAELDRLEAELRRKLRASGLRY